MKGRPITDHADEPRLILWPLPDQRHLYMLVAGVVLGVLLGPAVLGLLMPNEYDRLFIGSGDLAPLEQARADYAENIDGLIIHETQEGRAALRDINATIALINARIQSIDEQYALVGEPGDSTTIARDEQVAPLLEERAAAEQSLPAVLSDARIAVDERLKQPIVDAENQVLQRQALYQAKLSGMATMMLLLVVVLFAAEAILCPQRDELERGRAELPPMLSRLVTVRYGLAAGWLMLMLAQPVWLRGIDLVFGGLLLAVVIAAGLVPLGKRAGKAD